MITATAKRRPSRKAPKPQSPVQSRADLADAEIILPGQEYDLADITRQCWEALQGDILFQRAGRIVQPRPGPDGQYVLRELTTAELRCILADRIAWTKWLGLPPHPARVQPPNDVATNMLATSPLPLPAVNRIVTAPTFAPDGTLLTEPGYHSPARVYYRPSGDLRLAPVSTSPDRAAIERAKGTIQELLCDFPFTGEAEYAHAVGLMLTPFVRDLIDGPTPLHLIEKPTQGTGSGLLLEVLLHPFLGAPPTLTPGPSSNSEWGYTLTALIRNGSSVVAFDNLIGVLDSADLSLAITASSYSGRLVKTSEAPSYPIRNIWAATANNLSLGSDFPRRTVRIRLDAKVEEPWLRPRENWKHELPHWGREHRRELVWSALTLIRAWQAAGEPDSVIRLGTFESWSDVIGGILHVAAIPGFLGNLKDFYAASGTENNAWYALIDLWSKVHGEEDVTMWDIWPLADEIQLGGADLGLGRRGDSDDSKQMEPALRKRLGKRLGERRDRRFGNWILRRNGTEHGSAQYHLEEVVA